MGVACTLLFIRNDLYDPFKKVSVRHTCKSHNYQDTKYVQDLTQAEKSKISFKTVVGIDPGVDDLIYCTNGDTKIGRKENGKLSHKTTTFRYSRM
jgi:transposase